MAAQEVHRVIGRYELGQVQSLQSLGNAGGFSGARLWKVTSDRGVFCVRRWPVNVDVDVGFIHQSLRRAEDAGLPVAAPITNRDHHTVTQDGVGFEWELARWVEGAADFNQSPSFDRLVDAVQTLAKFHVATSDQKESRRSEALQFRLARLADAPRLLSRLNGSTNVSVDRLQWVGPNLISDLAGAINPLKQRMSGFANESWPMVCAIRDIHHDHLFFQDDRLTGIVDFGAMRNEARCFDLARLIGSLNWNGKHPWEESLKIYSELDPISDAEVELIQTLHECNIVLGIINWLNWIYLEQRKFDDWNAVKIRINWLVEEFVG